MKKSIKKAALTTLSAVAILSAVPSAFCAPYGKNQNVNERGHIDGFHAMVVGKYFNSVEDFRNLSMVSKNYRNILEKYRYNPVEINSREQLALFPNIETCLIGKFEKDFITKFPNETIKTMIYLPNSFNSSQFRDVLKDNGIVDENGNHNDKWERRLEFNSENSLDDCKVTFTDGDKTIIFVFNPCAGGTISRDSLREYNEFLTECGIEEAAVTTVNISGEFTIPDYVTSIGEGAFENCHGLTRINIPSTVTSIGESAFFGCERLTNVTIPDSVTSIGKWAFFGCKSLTNITIPNSVTSIETNAFKFCENLTNITIPDSVTSIECSAFAACGNLDNVVIPGSVTSIGEAAFMGCRNLDNVVIPGSVTSIGEAAFMGCRNLTNITIPDGVRSIRKSTFECCLNLRNVTIPNSVTSIEEKAFKRCMNLNHIDFDGHVYNSVDSFMQAFNDYINLKPIEFDGHIYYSLDRFLQAYNDYRASQQ